MAISSSHPMRAAPEPTHLELSLSSFQWHTDPSTFSLPTPGKITNICYTCNIPCLFFYSTHEDALLHLTTFVDFLHALWCLFRLSERFHCLLTCIWLMLFPKLHSSRCHIVSDALVYLDACFLQKTVSSFDEIVHSLLLFCKSTSIYSYRVQSYTYEI